MSPGEIAYWRGVLDKIDRRCCAPAVYLGVDILRIVSEARARLDREEEAFTIEQHR